MDGWLDSEEMFDMNESSSVGTSRNTTRAPSPVIEEPVDNGQSIPKIAVFHDKVELNGDKDNTIEINKSQPENSTLTTGRSRRQVKRPPKRFDD